MINVNAATKNAYLKDSSHKVLTVSIPELNIELVNKDYSQGTMEYTESVVAGESIEFVGCIASVFKITIHNVSDDISGQQIIVSIKADNTETVPLFTGYVDKVEQVPHKREKKIIAYDVLYKLVDIDIADWYNDLLFPISLKDFRDALFTYLGITQETITLVNDDIVIDKDYVPNKLSALDVIKSICQINCVFGRISRTGTFEYVTPPSPSTVDQAITHYKPDSTDYQEYHVRPVTKVIVHAGTEEVYYGDGENKYIINDNFFTKTLNRSALQTIAQNLYTVASGFSYQPFNADVNGLPYLQCLDVVSLPVYPIDGSSTTPTVTPFVVLERTMKGVQALRDNLIAEGDEYQHEFVTNISVDIEELKAQVNGLVQKEFTSYEVRVPNDKKITIHNEQVRILTTRIASNTDTKAQIHVEVNVGCEADEDEDYTKAVVSYVINSEEIEFYPTETWIDGDHIMHLMYILGLQANTTNYFDIYMRAVDGTITIPKRGIWLYASGAGLVGDGKWDGTITVIDEVERWTIPNIIFRGANDSVDVGTQIPTASSMSDSTSRWNIPTITFESAEDSMYIEMHTDVFRRITEDGDVRVTNDDDVRYTEGD